MNIYINKNNVMELLLNKISSNDIERKPELYSIITGVKEMDGFTGFTKPDDGMPKNEEEVHVVYLSRSGSINHAIVTYLKKGTKIVEEDPPALGGSKEERLLNAIFGGIGKERKVTSDGFYIYECDENGLCQWRKLNAKVIAWISLADLEKMVPKAKDAFKEDNKEKTV